MSDEVGIEVALRYKGAGRVGQRQRGGVGTREGIALGITAHPQPSQRDQQQQGHDRAGAQQNSSKASEHGITTTVALSARSMIPGIHPPDAVYGQYARSTSVAQVNPAS